MPAVLRVFICELFIEGQMLLLLSSGIPKSFVKNICFLTETCTILYLRSFVTNFQWTLMN